jgi:hypothetical protein
MYMGRRNYNKMFGEEGSRHKGSGKAEVEKGKRKEEDKKNGVIWDVTPCGSCKNRHFGEI